MARWQAAGGMHPAEAPQLVLDASKARQHLGWKPRTSLDGALQWSVEWYRAWHEGGDVRRIAESQIEHFSSRHA